MGYTTKFSGCFHITPSPDNAFRDYINRFAKTRHEAYDVARLQRAYKGTLIDHSFYGLLGPDGLYFVDPEGKEAHSGALRHIKGNPAAPGIWCQWVIEGGRLMWDGGEKFYHYIEWLSFLIHHFFAPAGYSLDGTVCWSGERAEDAGRIVASGNNIIVRRLGDEI